RPLDARVDPASIVAHGSSKRPSVELGELAILYAAVWQAIYGVVEVASVPEHDPARERWAWRFAIRPLAVVRDLHDAPPVEAAENWADTGARATPRARHGRATATMRCDADRPSGSLMTDRPVAAPLDVPERVGVRGENGALEALLSLPPGPFGEIREQRRPDS